jgi:DNA-binding SARP family transcriptional activator
MAALSITLFGAMSLHGTDQPAGQFPSGKIRNLLAYLLLNRQTTHAREHLAGLFWGDQDEQKARHCLNTALWRLNRLLDESHPTTHPYLRVDAQTIGWNTASVIRLDIEEFESRCTLADQMGDDAPEQQARLYEQAIECYRADLLIDCYEDWCLIERERFRFLYLHALGRLMAYHMDRRAHDDAIECGRRILACDPLREEVHRDLIVCHLAINRPGEALRQYRTCEELVRRELDEEPMPETQALLPRIIGANRRARAETADRPTPIVALAPGDDLAQQLLAATARLREAIIAFDASRSQLDEITAFIEEIGRRVGVKSVTETLERTDVPPLPRLAGRIEHVVVDLEQILRARSLLPIASDAP